MDDAGEFVAVSVEPMSGLWFECTVPGPFFHDWAARQASRGLEILVMSAEDAREFLQINDGMTKQ